MDGRDILSPVYRADGKSIDIVKLDESFGKWVHTGRNITISPCDNEYVKRKLKEPDVYPITKHIRGKVILISNTGYQALRLLKDLFTQMCYKIGIYTEKTSEEMHNIISTEAAREENKLIDSFVVVIYGIPENFNITEVANALTIENAKYLENKPKLVYIIGGEPAVRQVEQRLVQYTSQDVLIGATGFNGMMFFIYIFCTFVHELSAKDIWKILIQYANYHTFPASTFCTLRKDFFFFPNASISVLPDDLANLDPADIQLYKKLLQEGWVDTYNIRLMFVGLFGAGKTSTARRIMGKEIDDVTSTDGIDVYIGKCKVDLSNDQWETLEDPRKSMPLTKLAEHLQDPRACTEHSGHEDMDIYSRTADKSHKRRKLESRSSLSSSLNSSEFEMINIDSSTRTSSMDRSESFGEPDIEMVDETDTQTSNTDYLKTAQRVLQEAKESNANKAKTAIVSLWDFAGQFVYYATHQLFFSPRSIYLLVVNMEDGELDKTLDGWYMDLTGKDSIEAQGGVHFWLSSIYTYARGETEGVPPIILVGTHKDKMKGSDEEKRKTARKRFRQIRDMFFDSPISKHIRSEDILLDNSVQDSSSIDQLKQVVMDVSKEMFYWGQKDPAKYIELEQALVDRRNDGTNFITMKEFKEINQKLASPLQSEEHLKLFLKIQHQKGTIINFSDTEQLKDIIILEPQWIINAFRHLIRAKDFGEKYGHLKKQWEDFNDTGKLDIGLAESIWKQDLKNHFYENFDMLLEFLAKLDIIVRASQLGENGITKKPLGFYYVPCLLKEMPPDNVLHLQHIPDGIRTPVLCFTFRESFLPPAIFNRVLALCLGKWPVARQGKHTFLYCGCAVFEVKECDDEDRHRLHIFFKKSKIGLRISRYSTKGVKEVDRQVCDRVRRFITKAIRNEFNRFQNKPTPGMDEEMHDRDPFYFQIQCTDSNPEDVLDDGLHDIKELTDMLECDKGELDAFCRKHNGENEPHSFEPVKLLKEWFPDKIPECHRESTETVLESWFNKIPEGKKSVDLSKLADKYLGPFLTGLSASIGKNWMFLMHDLVVTQVLIDQKMSENPREVSRSIYEALKHWIHQTRQPTNPDTPTAGKLLDAIFQAKNVTFDWEEIQNCFDKLPM
ncbi:uncharacterized protein LOC132738467 [Ruditapes philippinarum]|uniref:uncharacterized protein LOC132738467 n=1 Tax=Ruditapes philippinarum TaxID=129788 RepID=UPI00295B9A71|nr:uncharacterized protein LOC132738467 [Ruditapes philippinarum]